MKKTFKLIKLTKEMEIKPKGSHEHRRELGLTLVNANKKALNVRKNSLLKISDSN